MNESSRARLTRPQKAVFGLGDHTVNVSLGALSMWFLFFLVTVAGLEPWLAGVLIWLARLVDAVSDPLMGRISDRTPWRAGRRRPYFLIGAIPFGACFALLWTTPFEGQAAMFAYYLIVYIGLCLSMTVLSVPYMALIPEIAQDYDERTSVNAFRSGAAIMGTMVAAGFSSLAESFAPGAAGFARAGAVLSIWLAVVWPFVFRVSFEPEDRPPRRTTSIAEGLRRLARHRNFVQLSALFVSARIAVDLLGLGVPFYITLYLQRSTGDTTRTLFSMLLVVVLSLPFWLKIARRRDKHHIFMFGATWFVACLCAMGLARPEWPTYAIYAVAAVLGIGYAVADLMPWAMLGEVIDEDELISGERREGVYNGVFTFLRKIGGATAFMIGSFALSAFGYVKEGVQPESALDAIRVISTAVPAVFLLLAVLLARSYSLGRKRHIEILGEIDQRRRGPAPT